MVTAPNKWEISGDYFENCNCAFVCPCPTSGLRAMPTEGHCDVPLAFHIDEGRFGDTALRDLNAVVVIYTPGPMIEGNWSVAAYIDERADETQRAAMGAIFSGSAGGPLAVLSPLISTNLGAKFVAITYAVDGKQRHLSIPGILEMNVEGTTGANPAEPMYFDNIGHPASTRLALAKGTRTTYNDHSMTWDNTGKNGHYASIKWSNG
jgi:hypothetical protein